MEHSEVRQIVDDAYMEVLQNPFYQHGMALGSDALLLAINRRLDESQMQHLGIHEEESE
jgi:hypothetical protein